MGTQLSGWTIMWAGEEILVESAAGVDCSLCESKPQRETSSAEKEMMASA